MAETYEQPDKEPPCTPTTTHDWFVLGIEDSGEEAARCGSCMTRRYTKPNGKVRYELA